MKVFTYEDSLADIVDFPGPTVFLAGPTVRGNQLHLTSWRFGHNHPDRTKYGIDGAISIFESLRFEGALIVPEFLTPKESDKGKLWIPRWEYAGLCGSDVNMFWIPRTKELIGLTTNHEHGYWLARFRHKMVYGGPPDAYRNTYLDEMWRIDAEDKGYEAPAIHANLFSTVVESIHLARNSNCAFRTKSRVPVDSPYGVF